MIYAEMLRLDADVLLRETTEFTKQERSVTARLLVRLAAGRSKAQLLDWLACRFPRPAVPTVIRPVTSPVRSADVAPTQGLLQAPLPDCKKNLHALARVPVPSSAPNPPTSQVPLRDRAHVEPLNAEQVKVQFTMSRGVLAKMQQAQALLGHQVPRHDIAALFEKLLDMALRTLEKKKFAATNRPRAPREASSTSASTPSEAPAACQDSAGAGANTPRRPTHVSGRATASCTRAAPASLAGWS